VAEYLRVFRHVGFFCFLHATGTRDWTFDLAARNWRSMETKPRWIVFGAGVGLGLSLAVTSPGLMGKGNVETHREPPRVPNAQSTRGELEPTTASKGRLMEAAQRLR
jgi:hypothetical protein